MMDVKKLWALPDHARAETLWEFGAHPDTDEMRTLFRSCASVPVLGTLLVMAIPTGMTPNGRFYVGRGRHNESVWGEGGCPVQLPKRARSRRPSKRAQERAMQAFYRQHGLFKCLPCGCTDQCPGADWHAAIEAAEDGRERELREEHALFDARQVADELAHATLHQPLEVDSETAAEFAEILLQPSKP